jgi:hypothetical protein
MDTVLKSLTAGFLLRSLFAGLFFVFSYTVVTTGFKPPDLSKLVDVDGLKTLWLLLPMAFFFGMTIYVIHRSCLYPLIEAWFDSDPPKTRRECEWPIRERSVKALLARWDYSGQTNSSANATPNPDERVRHLVNWADQTHFQYVAGLCVCLGAWVGDALKPIADSPFWTLLVFGAFLWILALVSDWRLRMVWDAVLSKPKEPTGEAKSVETAEKAQRGDGAKPRV